MDNNTDMTIVSKENDFNIIFSEGIYLLNFIEKNTTKAKQDFLKPACKDSICASNF
jgi:hypothetical protein